MYLADYVPRFPKNAHEALFVGESIKQCVVRISNQRNVPMSLEKDQEVIWLRYGRNIWCMLTRPN